MKTAAEVAAIPEIAEIPEVASALLERSAVQTMIV